MNGRMSWAVGKLSLALSIRLNLMNSLDDKLTTRFFHPFLKALFWFFDKCVHHVPRPQTNNPHSNITHFVLKQIINAKTMSCYQYSKFVKLFLLNEKDELFELFQNIILITRNMLFEVYSVVRCIIDFI